MNRGYIKLFRKIEENDIYMSDEPFDKRSAWIDLILLANHKDNGIIRGMNKIIIKKGQHKTSIVTLSNRWHWSTKKVNAYLELLQNEGMIYVEKHRSGPLRGVLITLVNYSVYQDFSKEKVEQKSYQKTEQKSEQRNNTGNITGDIKGHINNNDKNDIKNDIKNETKMNKKPAAGFVCGGERYYEE